MKEIDIIKELTNLYKKGLIKSLRGGDTGIGYTLETELGIEENNLGEADFKYGGLPVELKAQREKASSRVTLITKTPNWVPLSLKEIIQKFGYNDREGRQALKITLDAIKFNPKGFKLEVDKSLNKLNIIHKTHGVVSYYDITELMKTIKKKLYKNLILVLASSKIINKEEYFQYKKAILLKNLSEKKFKKMIDGGLLVWEFRTHIRTNGTVRDHGPGFRISKAHISKLYNKEKIIFDSSKLFVKQK